MAREGRPGRRASLRLVIDGGSPGPWNMALDEALMGSARHGAVTLRLYRWRPPCLSLGRNQPARGRYDASAAAERSIGIVRRPTGGRAVYHDRELTYAVAAPDRLWGGPRCAYARIHRALTRGLARLGAPVDLAAERGGGRAPAPSARACFRDPAPGEVTCRGRKLVGSALWRRGGALLQHGSVLIHDDQRVVDALRARPPAAACGAGSRRPGPVRPGSSAVGAEGPGSIGLAEACGRAPALSDLVAALVAGFEEEFGVRAVRTRPRAAERATARRLEAVYASREWTWRR